MTAAPRLRIEDKAGSLLIDVGGNAIPYLTQYEPQFLPIMDTGNASTSTVLVIATVTDIITLGFALSRYRRSQAESGVTLDSRSREARILNGILRITGPLS